MERLDHASGSISFQPPDTEREKNQLLSMAGIEPGPPAQQASVLSITQLPRGFQTELWLYWTVKTNWKKYGFNHC